MVFGQSAAFSGPAQELGLGMRLGIQAAFHEANQNGGVHGRTLELETLDDFYEPDSAFSNTMTLINAKRVFALIGEVGTPTSRAAVPAADLFDVPFLAPFTGAQFLRDPGLGYVLNLRASYYQETEGNGGPPYRRPGHNQSRNPLSERLLRRGWLRRVSSGPGAPRSRTRSVRVLPAKHQRGEDSAAEHRPRRPRGPDNDRAHTPPPPGQ